MLNRVTFFTLHSFTYIKEIRSHKKKLHHNNHKINKNKCYTLLLQYYCIITSPNKIFLSFYKPEILQ